MTARPTPTWEGMVTLPDGYRRHVVRFGEKGEVLVGLHGGPGASLATLLPLAEIADGRLQVVLYDQLGGSGGSDRPDDDDLWTVETYVAEFEALVVALELGRVHLLGHSWGGQLALECAWRCPQLIKSLVLCGTLASTATAIVGYDELIARYTTMTRAELSATEYDPADDSEAGRVLRRLFATHWHRSRPFELEASEREAAELLEDLSEGEHELSAPYRTMWGENEFAPTGPLKDWDVSGHLAEIASPALVVGGFHDELVPACSQQIVDGLASARWLLLGQSSHMIFHEAERDTLLAAISDFAVNL